MIKLILFILLFTSFSSAAWYGQLLSPADLNMEDTHAAFYYGLLGIVCGYSFVQHFRSF